MKFNFRTWIFAGILAVIFFVIGKAVYQISRTAPCFYQPLLDSGNRCKHLFQDSIKQNIECFHSFGNSNGAECAYKLGEKYRYVVWELGEFRNVDLNKIFIIKQENLDQIKENAYSEVEYGGNPLIVVRDIICYSIDKELDVLNTTGEIVLRKVSDSCVIASGGLNELAIANYKKEIQLLIKFDVFPSYSTMVFLKKNKIFYLILINSTENKVIPAEALRYLKLPGVSSAGTDLQTVPVQIKND